MWELRARSVLFVSFGWALLLGGGGLPARAAEEPEASKAPPDSLEDARDELPPGALAWARSPIGQLEGEYLRLLVEVAPVRATLLGLHGGDGNWGPAGPAERAASSRWAAYLAKLKTVDPGSLDPDDRYDLDLLIHEARWRLFELDTLRSAARDPGVAVSEVANGLYGVLARDYAPLDARARSLAGRLAQVPAYLDVSARSLSAPPRILVDQALSRAEALSLFLIDELPAATAGVTDSVLADSLTRVTAAALEAVWAYRRYLTDKVTPRASESFSLGDSLFLSTVHAAEGVNLSLDALRALADGELDRLETSFRETASRIDPALTPEEVLRAIAEDHPGPGGVLEIVEDALDEARRFVLMDGSVPLAETPRIEVRASPRASRWASATLAFPGPFEDGDFPAVFYVTMPDPFTPEGEREESARFLSRPLLRNLAVHEGFPGHSLQAVALRRVMRPARRAIWSTAFVEGWAHYAESLMLERGHRPGDDAFELLTLQSGLRRAGRFRVALGLHTEGWSLEEAEAFMARRAFLDPSLARREAERGAVDPLYLVYTLGRMQIQSLRAEMERIEGTRFDLARFHRRLLALGAPPLVLARARLLAPEAPATPYLD